MKHPTDEKLRAYFDGELPLSAAAAIGEHLAECSACAAVAAELRETAQVFTAAMARMDALEPEHWRSRPDDGDLPFLAGEAAEPRKPALRIVRDEEDATSGAGDARVATPIAPASRERQFRRPRRSAAPLLRWAAGIALTVAIGGSAAIATGILRVGSAPEATIATTPASSEPVAAAGGGVFGRPVDGAMEVVLTNAPAGSRVIIEWSDAPDVLVEVTGAPEARVVHRDGEERMVANLADRAGVVRVTMPRGLRSGSVVWQDRIVVQVVEGTVSPEGAAGEGVVLEAQR